MANKKRALVTGGSRGIGRAISLRLAQDGYQVIVNFRSNAEEAEKTCSLIKESGGDCTLSQFDVSDSASCATAITNILSEGAIDVLVLSAGIHRDNLLIFMEEKDWKEVLDINLTSFYHIAKPIVKEMLLQRRGRVIAISSTSAETGLPGQVNYSAAKAGINGAVKALAQECAKRNVLVNAITPGFIETEMTETMNNKELASRVPLQRLGKPEEVASVVSFLASSESTYITGQIIGVNGGIFTG